MKSVYVIRKILFFIIINVATSFGLKWSSSCLQYKNNNVVDKKYNPNLGLLTSIDVFNNKR